MNLASRLDSLTGMRGIAALVIVLHHSAGGFWPLATPAKFGYVAVTFFFCLSGFVMEWSWRGDGGRAFFLRRLARVWPLVILGLVISLASYRLGHSPLAGYEGNAFSVVASLFMVQSWFFNTQNIRQSWDGVAWSLSCEIFFYALFPWLHSVVSKLAARNLLKLTAGLVLAYAATQIVVVAGFGQGGNAFFYFCPLGRFPEFIAGVLLGRAVKDGLRVNGIFGGAVLGIIAPLAAYAWLVPAAYYFPCFSDLVVLPACLYIIALGATRSLPSAGQAGGLLASRPMVWLGEVSFALYMMHAFVILPWKHFIERRLGLDLDHPHLLAGFGFIVSNALVAVAVAALVHYWVELTGQRALLFGFSKFWPVAVKLKPKADSVPA